MKLRLVIAALSLGLCQQLLAQTAKTAKPDFTGAWKLREEVADFRAPLPNEVQIIAHLGSSFEITVIEDGKVRIPKEVFEIGAPAITRPSSCCGDGSARYFWEGLALHGTFTWASGAQEDVRTLSADGTVMTVIRTISQLGLDRVITWVFARQ